MTIQLDVAEIDQSVSQHGVFNLLDWLIEKSLLPFSSYEAWRHGRLPVLQFDICLTEPELLDYCKAADSVSSKMKLQSESHEFYGWGDNIHNRLILSANSVIEKALAQQWKPVQSVPQMDLFFDNSQTVCENTIIDALTSRQFVDADKALNKLTSLNASHAKLGGYSDLINYGQYVAENPLGEPSGWEEELNGLEHEVIPLATELLNAKKRDYLASAWRRIAEGFQLHPAIFDEAKLHPSYPFTQIPDWFSALNALENDADPSRNVVLLTRLAQAYQNCQKNTECLWIWGMAFDRFGEEAEPYLEECKYPPLLALWDDFLNFDENWPSSVFMGFILISNPGLIHIVKNVPVTCQKITLDCNQAVMDLLSARSAGTDDSEERKALKNTSEPLFSYFLSMRY